MKILFYGDSITDMNRLKDNVSALPFKLGNSYALVTGAYLVGKDPLGYDVVNMGISGNRIVDLYARIKKDVWEEKPDVMSILVGVNDVWHEIINKNGVDIVRFEKIYRMLIEDTLEVLPNLKMMLMEPFVLEGSATKSQYESFLAVKEYAKVVKKLADEYGLVFVELQSKFDKYCEKYGTELLLYDGVHPNLVGTKIISDAWIEAFEKNFEI